MNGINPQDQSNHLWNGQRMPEQPTADAANDSSAAVQPDSRQPAQPMPSAQPIPRQPAQPNHPPVPQTGMPIFAPPQSDAPGAPAGAFAPAAGQPRPVYGYAGGQTHAAASMAGVRPSAAGVSPAAAPSANGISGYRPSAGPAAAPHANGGSGAHGEGPRRRAGRWVAIGALMLACILGGGAAGGFLVMRAMRAPEETARPAGYVAAADPSPSASAASDTGVRSQTDAAGGTGALSVEEIAAKAAPSVVAISTEARVQDMFGRVGYAEGAGSGVIISKDGYIVTNHHVVNGARSISVTLATGDRYDAELIGSDASNDIAVIKIQASDLPAIEVASSSELKLGSTVVAIGNPLGVLEGTVTDGIISATSRNIQTEDGVMYNVLQTNAAINRGNSGGALVNNRGQLVGINSNKATGNSVEGIAFAIPSDTVMPLVNQLIENGEVRSPEIGIVAASITSDMQQAYKLPAGIYVQSVKSGSPAEKAGLKERDIITEVDGQSIGTLQDFTALKNRHQTGDTIKLTVQRDGETVSLDVVLDSTGS